METKTNRTVMIAIVTGVITLLLGLCLGALVGGAGGFLIGKQAGQRTSELLAPDRYEMPEEPAAPVEPEFPSLPERRGWLASGAWVREVVSGSPAEAAGLQVGDIIVGLDDAPIDANHRLVDILAGYHPGDRVTLRVLRDSAEETVKVTLGESPTDAGRPYLGIRYFDTPTDMEPEAPGD